MDSARGFLHVLLGKVTHRVNEVMQLRKPMLSVSDNLRAPQGRGDLAVREAREGRHSEVECPKETRYGTFASGQCRSGIQAPRPFCLLQSNGSDGSGSDDRDQEAQGC